jgi:hypothetical protein
MTKPKKSEEPREMPGDFKCDLDPPRSRLMGEVIALIEGEGGPEPSAVKKHLMACRRLAWESKQAGSGPSLQHQLQRADARVEALRRECEPCARCHRGADAVKLKALAAARRERVRVAETLAARHALLDQLRSEREKAMAQLRESAVRALASLVMGLGIPAALNLHRALYVAGYEEIPAEVVRRCKVAEKAGELARRVDPTSRVGDGQIFPELDKELSAALGKRLDMPAGRVMPEAESAVA